MTGKILLNENSNQSVSDKSVSNVDDRNNNDVFECHVEAHVKSATDMQSIFNRILYASDGEIYNMSVFTKDDL